MADKSIRHVKAGKASAGKQDMAALGRMGGLAKVPKGLAKLSPEKRREISNKGGIATQRKWKAKHGRQSEE